jgi:nucleotide-binding universal stress UspA family protein
MARSILVPLDGSGFAEHALPHALAFADPDARLHLVLVHRSLELWDATRPDGDSNPWATQLKRNEEDYLAEVARRLREMGRSVDVSLMDGDVVGSITACARHAAADLIVITSHARGGVERAWLGSVAGGVIRGAAAPVLVVRPSDDTRDALSPAPAPRVVLVAWDGSEEARAALDQADRLAERTGARLMIARVITPYVGPTSPFLPHAVQFDRDFLEARTDAAKRDLAGVIEDLEARVPGRGPVRVLIEVHATPARGILELADENDADLIVMGTHGRGAAARVVLGSVSDKVVRAASIPVMLCRKAS